MEEDKLRRARRWWLINTIIDPIIGIVFILGADSMSESYRYYYDSDYRTAVKVLTAIGFFLFVDVIFDGIMYIYYDKKLRALEQNARMKKPRATLNLKLWCCPDCGKELSRQATVCPHCGRPIAAGEAEAQKQKIIAAGEAKAQQQKMPAKRWLCPKCGENNLPGTTLCVNCGRYRYTDIDER